MVGYLNRRDRLELGLYQKDVAASSVSPPPPSGTGNGWTVDNRLLPRVIAFIGYNPFPQPEDVLE